MNLKSYKELTVWQKSIDLVKEIYKVVKHFPQAEQYILISQMLRAAVSIPSNIAEGWARNHKAEFIRFLGIAFGSSTELETQIIIAKEQYRNVDYSVPENLLQEVQKMLVKLISNTKQSDREW